MMKEAINHEGFALLDILQPCVTFNKVNTYQWFASRVYRLDASYDPTDRAAAFAKALEPADTIPLGIIYRNTRPPYTARAEKTTPPAAAAVLRPHPASQGYSGNSTDSRLGIDCLSRGPRGLAVQSQRW